MTAARLRPRPARASGLDDGQRRWGRGPGTARSARPEQPQLLFATQAPKGLHNRIPGNAATQFIGFLDNPIQITAAQDIARAKGGEVADISRLHAGEFHAARAAR